MRYNLVHDGEGSNLTAFIDGQMYVATSDHPYWDEITDALIEDDGQAIIELIDLATQAQTQFQSVTERVSVNGGVVRFDGDVIDNALSNAIVRSMRFGKDIRPLARFMEKCYTNPNRHSRDNLFTWLNTHDFTINDAGNLIGYKGVRSDLASCSSGPGIVNGQHVNGHLDNSVGNILEMSRSRVQHDPSQGCSTGLHVGTWDYASGFGQVTLKVEVNPRDVVSVPTDCSWAKMRVCRYKVLEVIDRPVDSFLDTSSDWDDDWDLDGDGWGEPSGY
jgi:hypothetical protein